jgi:hypothetical protein
MSTRASLDSSSNSGDVRNILVESRTEEFSMMISIARFNTFGLRRDAEQKRDHKADPFIGFPFIPSFSTTRRKTTETFFVSCHFSGAEWTKSRKAYTALIPSMASKTGRKCGHEGMHRDQEARN